jgi:hypothetical protein
MRLKKKARSVVLVDDVKEATTCTRDQDTHFAAEDNGNKDSSVDKHAAGDRLNNGLFLLMCPRTRRGTAKSYTCGGASVRDLVVGCAHRRTRADAGLMSVELKASRPHVQPARSGSGRFSPGL